MQKKVTLAVGLQLLSNLLYADSAVVVESVDKIFKEGKVSGQVRLLSAGYNQKEVASSDSYATAIGGILRYELAPFHGFNAGVAFYTAQDIDFVTGSDVKHNDELSSSTGHYTALGEAYLHYQYNHFDLRIGRQALDTPLVDTDEIRVMQDSFEAYTVSYKEDSIALLVSHIQSWQGYDAGLENKSWSKTGANGTNVFGLTYDDGLALQIWYYNSTEEFNALYLEAGEEYALTQDIKIDAMMQYLYESELSSSGYGANIYGASLDVSAYGLDLNVAFDQSQKERGKQSFSGYGGGTMFTSMDTSIISDMAIDRDVLAIVGTLAYTIDEINLLYAYGDFNGANNSAGVKAHTVEQDVKIEYNLNDKFVASFAYAMKRDKEYAQKTENDWDRYQLTLNYNF